MLSPEITDNAVIRSNSQERQIGTKNQMRSPIVVFWSALSHEPVCFKKEVKKMLTTNEKTGGVSLSTECESFKN